MYGMNVNIYYFFITLIEFEIVSPIAYTVQ